MKSLNLSFVENYINLKISALESQKNSIIEEVEMCKDCKIRYDIVHMDTGEFRVIKEHNWELKFLKKHHPDYLENNCG